MSEGDSERTDMVTRLPSRELHETLLECIECGAQIHLKENPFKPTHHTDKAYCTCEDYGPAFVHVEIEPEPEPPDFFPDAVADFFTFWDSVDAIESGVVCYTHCWISEINREGILESVQSLNRSLTGHQTRSGCDLGDVIYP